jgi:hypothetical protein
MTREKRIFQVVAKALENSSIAFFSHMNRFNRQNPGLTDEQFVNEQVRIWTEAQNEMNRGKKKTTGVYIYND